MKFSLDVELNPVQSERLVDILAALLPDPRFDNMTVDLGHGYFFKGLCEMFSLHDDKGAVIALGVIGKDPDGNPGVTPTNITVSVVENPPAVVASMIDQGRVQVDAIPGIGLSTATLRLKADDGWTQDMAVTLVAEDGTMFANATIGAESASTALPLNTPPGPVPVTPPGGTATPLASSFSSNTSFSSAVGVYTGSQEVDLDGVVAKSGTSPALTYFTQADGSVSTTAVVAPIKPLP